MGDHGRDSKKWRESFSASDAAVRTLGVSEGAETTSKPERAEKASETIGRAIEETRET